MLLKRKKPFLFMEKGIMTESRTQSILEELAREAAARLPHPGALNIQVSGLKIIRREESNRLIDCVSSASVGFIVQGRKAARMLGANLAYGAGSAIVTSVELPDSFEAIGAARVNPFFGIVLDLEEDVMTTVLARLRDRPVLECMFGTGGIQGSRVATVFPAMEQMLDALMRLLRLADESAGAAFMAPLVKRALFPSSHEPGRRCLPDALQFRDSREPDPRGRGLDTRQLPQGLRRSRHGFALRHERGDLLPVLPGNSRREPEAVREDALPL